MVHSNELGGGLTVVSDGSSSYRVDYDWSVGVDPSTVVVTAVATVSGVAVEDLAPLTDVVDPDALDRLFRPTVDAPRDDGDVGFRFEGFDVTLRADGTIRLREVGDSPPERS